MRMNVSNLIVMVKSVLLLSGLYLTSREERVRHVQEIVVNAMRILNGRNMKTPHIGHIPR